MADRRDDAPLPHRPLSGPASGAKPAGASASGQTGRDSGRGSMTDRVSAAVRAAGTAVSPGAGQAERSGSSGSSSGRSEGTRTTTTSTTRVGAGSKPRGSRRARLRLVHLDPWSVMKTSFLLSIAFGIVTVVAVAVVWSVLGAAGVWDSINSTVSDVVGGDSSQNFDVKNYVGTSRVLGFAMIVAVLDVLLITAIATLAAFLYNLAAALLGGVEVTLAEDDH
ncbi:MAG: DUF3566 domain-containing protein [Nocardioidaceae bacterium]